MIRCVFCHKKYTKRQLLSGHPCQKGVTVLRSGVEVLTHDKCKFCQKPLRSWMEAVNHIYRECDQIWVECHSCEFNFKGKDYINHGCSWHYTQCIMLVVMFMVLQLAQFQSNFLPLSSLHIAECSFIGHIRTVLVGLLWNVCMAVLIAMQVMTFRKLKFTRRTQLL